MSTLNEVEMVRPEDVCIGPMKYGKCGCIAHWREELLYRRGGKIGWSLVIAFNDALIRLFGKCVTLDEHEGIVTPKDASDMFNMGLHEIGFTVGNPPLSAKRIAELRRKMTREGA